MRWLNVQEIYADGRHNAWPDICRWRGRYYVAFNCGGGGHGLCFLSPGPRSIYLSSTSM